LLHRLRNAGLHVEQQHPIQVLDEDGTLIGEYFADLVVEHCLIIELKTAKTIAPEHEGQVLGYLKSTRQEHGLLINFGSYRFQIRKYTWNESQSKSSPNLLGLLQQGFPRSLPPDDSPSMSRRFSALSLPFSSLRSLRSLRLIPSSLSSSCPPCG